MSKEKLQKFILGCDPTCIQPKVIIAPCWTPESVGIENSELISNSACQIWECVLEQETITYIVCGVGASFCADVVMALQGTSCKRILFLGSAGSLKSELDIGDIGIPNSIICGEGASRYLQEELTTDLFGKEICTSSSLQTHLFAVANKCVEEVGVNCFEGVGVSVESIYSQYRHLAQFEQSGCSYIDMESSAFLYAANKIGVERAVAYCISDNVKNNEALYEVTEARTNYRKQIRRKVMPQIIRAFLKGGNGVEYSNK